MIFNKLYLLFNPMESEFKFDNHDFRLLDNEQAKVILESLCLTSTAYKIPDNIWKKYLFELPSPIRSNDCIACLVDGPLPTLTVAIELTKLYIIRKESKPKKNEPENNLYFHYLIKRNDCYYFSETMYSNTNHWISSDDLEKRFGYNFKKHL